MAENDNLKPRSLGWSSIVDARARLREAGIGLPDLSLAEMLDEALGPDPRCLSANEVADIIASGMTLDPLLPRDAHVITCGACQEALNLFRSINPRRRKARIRFGHIEIPYSNNASLHMKVANCGDLPVLNEVKPGSVFVETRSNLLIASGGHVIEMIPPPQGASEATVVRFNDYQCGLAHGESVQEVSRGYANLSAI